MTKTSARPYVPIEMQETVSLDTLVVVIRHQLLRNPRESFLNDHHTQTTLFGIEANHKLARALSELTDSDPAAAKTAVLRLFAGTTRAETTSLLGTFPSRKWGTAPAWLRKRFETSGQIPQAKRDVGRSRIEPPFHERHGFAVLPKNSTDPVRSVLPWKSSDQNDQRLAKALSRVLRSDPAKQAVLFERLRHFSCFFWALEADDEQAIEADIRTLLQRLTRVKETTFGFRLRAASVGVVGLTLVRIPDIQEAVGKGGLGGPEQENRGIRGDVEGKLRLPKAQVTLEEIDEFLSKSSAASPVPTLSGFESAVLALHRDHLVPGLQRYLDRVDEHVRVLDGGNFGSFEANKAFVDSLRLALRRLQLRLECPTCHRPATLMVKQGTTITGSFLFQHASTEQRTMHGGKTSLPPLRLSAAS